MQNDTGEAHVVVVELVVAEGRIVGAQRARIAEEEEKNNRHDGGSCKKREQVEAGGSKAVRISTSCSHTPKVHSGWPSNETHASPLTVTGKNPGVQSIQDGVLTTRSFRRLWHEPRTTSPATTEKVFFDGLRWLRAFFAPADEFLDAKEERRRFGDRDGNVVHVRRRFLGEEEEENEEAVG